MKILQNIYFSNLDTVPHIGGKYLIDEGDCWSLPTTVRFAQNKLYFIRSGRCTLRIENTEYEGRAGRWFFIPAGAPHSYSSDPSESFSLFWVHFDIYPTDADIFRLLSLPYFVDVEDTRRPEELFERFCSSAKGSDIVDALRMKAAVMELFAEYVTLAKRRNTVINASEDVTLGRIMSYIDDNIEKNFSNSTLAAICHLHPSHFIRVFKARYGVTPAKHVQNRKMALAKRLVEETDLSVGEIMSRTGYVDACGFSKIFRSYFGRSPSAYRKKLHEMGEYSSFDRGKHKDISK